MVSLFCSRNDNTIVSTTRLLLCYWFGIFCATKEKKCFENGAELDNAIVRYLSTCYISKIETKVTYGENIGSWCIDRVTDMSYMFHNAGSSLNEDLSQWNTSSVTSMSHMFENAEVFNSDISNWDINSVSYMDDMFRNAKSFNQNLCPWGLQFTSPLLSSFPMVKDMFQGTSCETTDDPDFNRTPPGPFCQVCS